MLEGIATYSLERCGTVKAKAYIHELESCCQRLVEMPIAGRACDDISQNLRRIEQGSHVVLYRIRDRTIFISRILHQNIMPQRHLGGL